MTIRQILHFASRKVGCLAFAALSSACGIAVIKCIEANGDVVPVVAIIFKDTQSYIPDDFQKKFAVMAYDLSEDEQASMHTDLKKWVGEAISLYDENVVSDILNQVLIPSVLIADGRRRLGTYFEKTIVVASTYDSLTAIPEQEFKNTFHHEFSSVIYNKYGYLLDVQKFASIGTLGHSYRMSDNEEFLDVLDKKFLSMGYISAYGTRSLEDDINTFASAYMLGQVSEDSLAEYPFAKEKLGIIKRWYDSAGVLNKGCD